MRKKRTIYNIGTNIILQIIVIAYGFIVPKIIINHFGSDVNGLVSSITQFLAYITLLESGFGPVVKAALYKPIAEKNNKQIANILKMSERFFKNISFVFCLYILILCFIYPLIVSNSFSVLFTVSLIVIIGISTFAEYFFGMTYRLFLQANQKTYIISVIQIFTYVLSIIFVMTLAKMGVTIQVIKLVMGLTFTIRPLFQNYYVKKKFNIDFRESNDKYDLKQKWDGLAQHIAAVIHVNTDITVLTLFSTLSEVSVYSVYCLVINGIKSLILAFINGIDATFGDMIAKKEKNNLNKKYSIYEIIYNSICTIFFASTLLLIVPFITVYTKGVTDANYIRYTFGVLIVTSEYIWAIRQPYNELIKAAGHFKETRVGAWVECISNIVISIVLVWKFGIVGVAIGTIVAMTIRTIEFVYHSNKYILERPIWESVKKILLVVFETIIIVFICQYLPYLDNISYWNWIINAIMVACVASLVTLSLNIFFFKKEFKELINILKNLLNRKKAA